MNGLERFGLYLLALVLMLGGAWLWGHHVGATGVQTQWDAAKASQAAVAAQAEARNTTQALAWVNQFSAIGAKYEANSHAQAPAVADSVAAGVVDGTLRLRGEGECPAVRTGAMPTATVRSRAADAAATQALADRVQTAIAAVRAGDEADARERQLGEQVRALQGVLRAERTE